jgi:ceramide glucosyltransferase
LGAKTSFLSSWNVENRPVSWTVILAILALLSLVLNLWQWLVAARFPLHRRVPPPPKAPGVTLLKPLKGGDAETAACLRSWFEQDYPGPVQILLGVASAEDPVCPLVRQIMAEHPGREAQLFVCPESHGPNAKVSTLIQLEPRAVHGLLVISDADVFVPPWLLVNLLAPFGEPPEASAPGLVCCFYYQAGARNLAMRWEAQAVNADFWSSVLQAQSLKPLDFALGAVMALPQARLRGLGGFQPLAADLADDYQLGQHVARSGGRIALCPVVVECRTPPMSWREVWAHQLRWARTIRVCQPVPFFFSILSNATFWPLLWLAIRPGLAVGAAVAAALVCRLAVSRSCERKLAGPNRARHWWLAWCKDLLQVPVWGLAFAGNRIVWRGQRFRVTRGGKLVPD